MQRSVHERTDRNDLAEKQLLAHARFEARVKEVRTELLRLGRRAVWKHRFERARSRRSDGGFEKQRAMTGVGESTGDCDSGGGSSNSTFTGNEDDATFWPSDHVHTDASRRVSLWQQHFRTVFTWFWPHRAYPDRHMSYRVLVADDSSVVRALYVACLERAGYEVVQCSNGREALQMVTNYMPDAVLSDISMPELDGVELIEAIRDLDDDLLAAIPVVLITAWDDDDERARANRVGAARILLKPVDARDLRDALEEAINTAQTAVHV